MHILNQIFSVYVRGNFHVGLMVLCFFEMTHIQWSLPVDIWMRIFVFCLAFLAYSGIKNIAFVLKNKHLPFGNFFFKFLLIFAFLYSCNFFLFLSWKEQCVLIIGFLFCVAYSVPFLKTRSNLRNRFGVKIFIVAKCWTLLTAIFPLINSGQINASQLLFFAERYLMIFMATLPFEIADIDKDEPSLGTIPQRIGISNTRNLGYILLFLLIIMVYINPKYSSVEGVAFFGMTLAYGFAFFIIKPSSSEYISLFWIEGIPLIGLLLFHL